EPILFKTGRAVRQRAGEFGARTDDDPSRAMRREIDRGYGPDISSLSYLTIAVPIEDGIEMNGPEGRFTDVLQRQRHRGRQRDAMCGEARHPPRAALRRVEIVVDQLHGTSDGDRTDGHTAHEEQHRDEPCDAAAGDMQGDWPRGSRVRNAERLEEVAGDE